MARPMLDDLELQQVQTIEVDGDQVWVQHGIPALEGDFLQGLGRRASQITLTGVLTGAEVADSLKKLRDKFRAAAPVDFVADIATAIRVAQVLIEEMGVRELAGRPARFEYAFTLREFTPATPTEVIIPPPPPPPPPPRALESVLEVQVIVEGDPTFDHARTVVIVDGRDEAGQPVRRTLPNDDPAVRQGNLWTVNPFPAGTYTATATTTTTSPALIGSATVRLPLGQTQRAIITLRQGQAIATGFMIHYTFDRAFVEPCMRAVLRQVVDFAAAHRDQKFIIVGHTDESGSGDYNQSLSERRARAAHAFLTFGRDAAAADAAVAEWNALRLTRPTGEVLTTRDSWGAREYQHMLQDLGFYSGQIDSTHNADTDQAVRDFQAANGLSVDGQVGDQTWPVLIRAYMAQDSFAVPETQFMPNANAATGCDNGVVRWLGCGEQMTASSPRPPLCSGPDPAWRPNRRTEFLFVSAGAFPCEIAKPVTFEIEPRGGSGWCLGPGNPQARCCFLTRSAEEQNKFLVQPAEPGTFVVNGRIQFEDGTPLANTQYVLIAPDGEFMNGEVTCANQQGTRKGTPVLGRTDANGNLTDNDGNVGYANAAKGPGIYTLAIAADVVARNQGEPITAANAGPQFPNWRGTYFNRPDLSGAPVLVRDDAYLNQNWGTASPGPGVNADFWSARWTRAVSVQPGRYRVVLNSDDGSRLWINNQLVIDNWIDQATSRSAEITASGNTVNVVVEFYDSYGPAFLQVDLIPLTGVAILPPGPTTCNLMPTGLNAVVTATVPLNVRRGPGTMFEAMTQLQPCTTVPMTGFRSADSQWVQVVVAGGQTGWVSAQYVRTGVPVSTLSPAN